MTPLTHIFWITISSLIFFNTHHYQPAALMLPGSSQSASLEKEIPKGLIFEEDKVDLSPVLLNRDEIESLIGYPSVAWDAGIEGKVVLRVLVDEKGYYIQHEVAESFHPLLRIPCEEFAKFLAFTPAEREKQSVKCWVEIPFEFKIP